MPIDGGGKTLCAIGGIAVIGLIWFAYQQTDSKPVPKYQGERQMMGLGVALDTTTKPRSPLDTNYAIHGYHPGFDPDPSAQPVTQSKHRYPAVPGGNISTVIHKGWSALMDDAPAGNDWRVTPPSEAVL